MYGSSACLECLWFHRTVQTTSVSFWGVLYERHPVERSLTNFSNGRPGKHGVVGQDATRLQTMLLGVMPFFFRIFLSVGGIAIPFHKRMSANRIGSYLLPLRYQFDRSVFSCSWAFPSPFTPSSYQDAVQTGELILLRWRSGLLHPVWRFHLVKQRFFSRFANREAHWEFLPVLLRSRAHPFFLTLPIIIVMGILTEHSSWLDSNSFTVFHNVSRRTNEQTCSKQTFWWCYVNRLTAVIRLCIT